MRTALHRVLLPLFLGLGAWPALADENVMVVFDGSNSMWGQIDGRSKVEIARGVMENLLGEWVDGRNVGLMAYGHRRRGDCGDIEVLVDPALGARQSILDRVNEITPTGKTPLTDSVVQAARALSYTDTPATVVLISDGLESCERDPCAVAAELEAAGVGFTAHVVGFGLGADEDASSLACIAETTGGQFISASSADELGAALATVGTAVAQVAPPPAPEPEPEPEPEPAGVTVVGPATAVGGSAIAVTWDPTLAEQDYITVVPVGTAPGVFGIYARIGNQDEVRLAAPGEAGLYEIRYLRNDTKETAGQAILEVTKPEVTLTTVDEVETGAGFEVSWSPTINEQDYIAIVPLGADSGSFGNYQRVGKASDGRLVAQADPGLYEVRYILNVDKRTVASVQVEVIAPQVSLEVPDTALAGSRFDVGWTGTVSEQDYIAIVPAGSDEGEFGNYARVGAETKGTLVAPSDTGLYEVRYILREGSRTLASEPIEVTAPEVTISGPQTVLTGAQFDVTWTGAVSPQDYAAVVPAGADEGEFGNYIQVRDAGVGKLIAPADPGLYEIRYILREGQKTLATAMVEVTVPEVTISAAREVRAGETLRVSWTRTVNAQDYITLVPLDTPDDKLGLYGQARGDTERDLKVPEDTGLYEVRYVLRQGARVLARQPVEVVAADAQLDTGATITAPDTAAPGTTIEIGWSVSSESADQRITIAREDHATFTWIAAEKISGAPPMMLTVPDEPGTYEIRFLDLPGQAVLSRKTIRVE